MMQTIVVLFFSAFCVQSLQSSSPCSVSFYNASPSLERLAADVDQYFKKEDDFRRTPVVQSLMFAIQKGYDSQLYNALWKKAVNISPDEHMTERLQKSLEDLYVQKSPDLAALQNKINSGATPAADRYQLQEKLEDLKKRGLYLGVDALQSKKSKIADFRSDN